MFGKYQNQSDLLFSDIGTSLVGVGQHESYRDVLGSFYHFVQDMDQHYCENSSHIVNCSLVTLIMMVIVKLML